MPLNTINDLVFISFPHVAMSLSHTIRRTSGKFFELSNANYGVMSTPWARSHLHSVGFRPSHASFTARSSRPHLHENSSLLGTNVTIPGHLSHWAPLACEGTTSINLGIMKVMSAWIFVTLTKYCHIGSQRERVPNFPTRKSSHTCAGMKIGQRKRHGRGMAQPNEDVI
jgi:hypothetical protein